MLQKIKEAIGVLLVLSLISYCIWYSINHREPKKYLHIGKDLQVELIDSFYNSKKKELQYIYLIEYKKNQQLIIN